MRATTEAARETRGIDPKKFIDSSYVIHHCGMYNHLVESGHNSTRVMEQAVTHAGAIVRATLSGKMIPVHAAPGIQLLATAVARDVIERGAAKLAADFGISLEDLKRQAGSEHVSFC